MHCTRFVLAVGCFFVSFCSQLNAGELVQREGRYVRLTTDLDSQEECDALVESFDAAVPQWIRFWRLPENSAASWKVHAYLIRDKGKFEQKGLIPDSVPDFSFGYTLGNQLWVLAQRSEYYTRHLLLHEGAHSFAFHQFQGAGPTWFMEGTAEMLATHIGMGSTVKINQIPSNPEAVPYWGRFRLIEQLRDANKVPSIETVMRYQSNLQGQVDAYGWSWAATMMLRAYPEYDEAFMHSARDGRDSSPAFNRRLFLKLRSQWPVIGARWRLMCHDLDFGFDWNAERVELSERDPVWNGQPIELKVAADRGWQSAGVRVPPGTKLNMSADGEVTLASDPKPWISNPPGITYRYHRGYPMGQLQACILPNAKVVSKTVPPLNIVSVAGKTNLEVKQFSWLLFRVNDSVGDLGNNRGEYRVKIE